MLCQEKTEARYSFQDISLQKIAALLENFSILSKVNEGEKHSVTC
jgi:hypothetical protein